MDDLRELLELLKSHNVQFLIIGAHAVGHHGYTRATKDVDVWVGRNLDNARRLAKALEEFGADIGEEGAASLASSGRKMIRLGFPPQMVDVLNFAGSEEFEQVWEGRVAGNLLGVSVNFPSKAALIEMKETSGRPQDLLDISMLKRGENL